jgi:LmbE family N-acetylglucosaminyl deacetylase
VSRFQFVIAAVLAGFTATPLAAQLEPPSTGGAVALAHQLRMLGHHKRVLVIGAHPDDEDTELLTILVRGDGAETAYLSLNRGEGGQNVIGPELGEALGLLRSEELLSARRLDGARQYFTRAYDFGFSKTLDDTWAHWPRDTILKDVVRVIRRFRPQIVVSIFSGTPRDGHGQHQAAGWAAQEAFRIAGDSTRFQELEREEGLRPWNPLKLYRSTRFDTAATTLQLDGGVLDQAVGRSYHQVAMASRSLHRSQDMGQLQTAGPSRVRLALMADRSGRGGNGFWGGVDTTLASLPADGPERGELEAHASAVADIRAGLVVDAVTDDDQVVPGEPLSLVLTAWNTSSDTLEVTSSIRAEAAAVAGTVGPETRRIAPGELVRREVRVSVATGATPTTPYFMREPRTGDLYRWIDDTAAVGLPFQSPLIAAEFRVRGPGGMAFTTRREATFRLNDPTYGEVRRPLTIVPRVGVRLAPDTLLWPSGQTGPQPFTVTLVHGARDTTAGSVHLVLPPGWPTLPPQRFSFRREDESRVFEFAVRPPARLPPGRLTIRAEATDAAGASYGTGVFAVDYSHIRPRNYVRPAAAVVQVAPLVLPNLARIGYVRGDLSRYDAIVIGSRAYETEPALAQHNRRLLEYAERGGLVLVQYQQRGFFERNYAPYPLTVGSAAQRTFSGTVTAAGSDEAATRALWAGSGPGGRRPAGPPAAHDRITDENAPVRLLLPNHPALRVPNRITAADWTGWVQERGLYFARSWDEHYQALIETHDPGEPPLEGGLLIARVGRGTYVYTGLAFFRELPAGVPGAWRLFANLLALAERK